MTDTAPMPKARRWRWLLASLLLGCGTIIWQCWPNADVRLVGRWSILGPDGKGISQLTLQSNGIGQRVDEGGTQFWFEWRVEGEDLVTGHSPRGQIADILNDLVWLARRPAGFIQTRERRAEIVMLGPETVQLRDRLVSENMTLQRVAQ